MSAQRSIDIFTETAIRAWAHQRRAMIVGEQPIASLLGRLKDQGPAAGERGARSQHWAEVYTGDGLQVQRILVKMTETPRLVLSCYYLLAGPWHAPVKAQAFDLGISVREYYSELDKAGALIALGLQLIEDPRAR